MFCLKISVSRCLITLDVRQFPTSPSSLRWRRRRRQEIIESATDRSTNSHIVALLVLPTLEMIQEWCGGWTADVVGESAAAAERVASYKRKKPSTRAKPASLLSRVRFQRPRRCLNRHRRRRRRPRLIDQKGFASRPTTRY